MIIDGQFFYGPKLPKKNTLSANLHRVTFKMFLNIIITHKQLFICSPKHYGNKRTPSSPISVVIYHNQQTRE